MAPSHRLARTVAAAWAVCSLCWCEKAACQEKTAATFGTTVVIPSGLEGRVYHLQPGAAWLPDFSRLRPVGTIYTTSLDVPPQEFSVGFPGVTNRFEFFAIDYAGRFWIDKPGEYQFALTSDDGSRLYIDDKLVVNLDGTHAPETEFRRIKLDCGIHHIRVSYFQGPRFQVALVLQIHGGGRKWRAFSTEEFKPPENPEDWVCEGKRVPYEPNRRSLAEAVKPAPPIEAEAAEALKGNPRPQDFPVRTAAFRFWRSAEGAQSSIVVAVPGSGLTATRTGAPTAVNKVHLALAAFVKAADGRVVERFHVDAPYQLPEAQYAAARAQDLVFSKPVHLPPGRYTVQAAAFDREGKRAGTAEMAVEVPERRNGIGLSSIVLADGVEPAGTIADAADPLIFQGRRVIPHLAPEVKADSKPLIYFVVYPDSSNGAKPAIQVQFRNEGRVVADQTSELPAPDASGAIPMFIALATRPGACELSVTVRQGSESASESVKYQVGTAGPSAAAMPAPASPSPVPGR